MSKTKFQSKDFGRCVMLTQPNGKIREYHIPYTSNGNGYVRESSNSGPQVCDGLAHSGSTLTATPETLLSVIKREWNKYRQSDSYKFDID